MHALLELRRLYRSLLVLDTASTRIQVGVLHDGQEDRWECSDEEAGQGVFRCLQLLRVKVASSDAFIFCEGPGSLLGIRTAAISIRVWRESFDRPVYAYRSLELVAETVRGIEATVIADARRDTWHAVAFGPTGERDELKRVETTQLAGRLFTPERFRTWSTPPPGVQTTSYALDRLFPQIETRLLFRETNSPDAFTHDPPAYVTWTPLIHRAPR